jgi:hypothetical protein
LREAGQGEEPFVDDDEETFGAGENGAVGVLDLGLMEELAALTAEMAADEDQRLVERNGTEVVDLHVTGHGQDVEGAVELAHGLIEERGYDAAMNVPGRAFVEAVELNMRCGDRSFWIGRIGGEDEVQSLRVGGTAAEAVAGSLVDGEVCVH